MEPEHVAKDSAAFNETDHLLQRDGKALTMGVRRGWNLHDPFVTDFLDERVIRMIKEANFGYLKIDYSETIGIGVDHPDSLGEGLRHHGEGTHAMFERIAAALPDLVIELVSAGGSRMEASLLQRSSMASYSDAHEIPEIPIVAAAMHRLILPRQSQIWAVLHRDDVSQRIDYTLAATFLGRMCLSGDIHELDDAQTARVQAAIQLYRRSVPVIKNGSSRLVGETGSSWRHPTGWQAVVRIAGNQGLIVVHTFNQSPDTFTIGLPGQKWHITETFSPLSVMLVGNRLTVSGSTNFASQLILIEQ